MMGMALLHRSITPISQKIWVSWLKLSYCLIYTAQSSSKLTCQFSVTMTNRTPGSWTKKQKVRTAADWPSAIPDITTPKKFFRHLVALLPVLTCKAFLIESLLPFWKFKVFLDQNVIAVKPGFSYSGLYILYGTTHPHRGVTAHSVHCRNAQPISDEMLFVPTTSFVKKIVVSKVMILEKMETIT